jgi:hypothetical protein
MIAHDIPPANAIHDELRLVTDSHYACFDDTLVHEEIRNGLLYVLDAYTSLRTNEQACVGYLSA